MDTQLTSLALAPWSSRPIHVSCNRHPRQLVGCAGALVSKNPLAMPCVECPGTPLIWIVGAARDFPRLGCELPWLELRFRAMRIRWDARDGRGYFDSRGRWRQEVLPDDQWPWGEEPAWFLDSPAPDDEVEAHMRELFRELASHPMVPR